MHGLKIGWNNRHLAGDSFQQGGTFVYNKNFECLLSHKEADPVDQAEIADVLTACGLHSTQPPTLDDAYAAMMKTLGYS